MTDSMKFGPEWLRNTISSDTGSGGATSGGGGGNSSGGIIYNNINHHQITNQTAMQPTMASGANGSGGGFLSGNNSGGSNTASSPGPRYPLAEFRYGREEMLSLFEKNTKPPEMMCKRLFVDKLQQPLALTPSTEEELATIPPPNTNRTWNPRSPVSFSATRGGTARGGSADRGRIPRGPRGIFYPSSFPRPTPMYEEDLRLKSDRGWPERNGIDINNTGNTGSGSIASGNGNNTGDWNGSPTSSPRKEFSLHSRNLENWRKNRVTDDGVGNGGGGSTLIGGNPVGGTADGGWRGNRWARSTSWREEDTQVYGSTMDVNSHHFGSSISQNALQRSFSTISTTGTVERSPSNLGMGNSGGTLLSKATEILSGVPSAMPSTGNKHHGWSGENEDNLPEWAMESAGDGSGGSFDATGAFHGTAEDRKERDRKKSNEECAISSPAEDEKSADDTPNDTPSVENSPSDSAVISSSSSSSTSTMSSSASAPNTSDIADRMQEVADDMVEKLIMDYDSATSSPAKQSTQTSSAVNPSTPSPSGAVPTVSATSNDMWYYRDPQMKVQGPFAASEMAEWYRAGYFDQTLFVRRVCDSRFAALGELIKVCGNNMPFLSSHMIPPLVSEPPAMMLPQQQQQQLKSVPPTSTSSINAAAAAAAAAGADVANTNTHQNIAQHQQCVADAAAAINDSVPKNFNPLMGNDMMTLECQLQALQKQYLIHQQASIFAKLTNSEPFNKIPPEQQQHLVSQQMLQNGLPEYLVSLSALSNAVSIINPTAYNPLQQILSAAAGKNDPQQVKPQQQQPQVAYMNQNDYNRNQMLWLQQQKVAENEYRMLRQPQPPISDWTQVLGQQQRPIQQQLPNNQWPALNNGQQPPAANTVTPNPIVSMWDFGSINPQIQQQLLAQQQLQQQQQQQQVVLQSEIRAEDELLQRQHQQQHQQQPTQPQVQLEASVALSEVIPPQQPQVKNIEDHKKEQDIKKQTEDNKQKRQSSSGSSGKTQQQKQQNNNNNFTVVTKGGGSNCNSKKQLSEKERREEKKLQEERKRQQQLEEEKKRLQDIFDEKQKLIAEEKKRQDAINFERQKAMMSTINQNKQVKQQPSIAPWSAAASGLPGISTPGPNLAEIQKAERRERRAEEQQRLMEMEKQQLQQKTIQSEMRDSMLKWNTVSADVKSLAEIQAEEAKRLANEHQAAAAAELQRRRDQDQQIADLKGNDSFTSIWDGPSRHTPTLMAWNGNGANAIATNTQQGSTVSANKIPWAQAGFWEDPQPQLQQQQQIQQQQTQSVKQKSQNTSQPNRAILTKSQTIASIMPSGKLANPNKKEEAKSNISKKTNVPKKNINASASENAIHNNNATGNGNAGLTTNIGAASNSQFKKDDYRSEFTNWCNKSLSKMNAKVDVPTFIAFLQDIESPFEVKDYIRMYLGETKDSAEFGKQFLERRSKYKNLQRAQNAHNDDLCQPAPAVNPGNNDFTEVKGKTKKVKKNKMTKLDARILGFSVTAAQDRINVGDRDYGDNA